MKIKSIHFPPPVADAMVRAILEGRKTVTRRVVKPLQRWVNSKFIFRKCEKFEDYKASTGKGGEQS